MSYNYKGNPISSYVKYINTNITGSYKNFPSALLNTTYSTSTASVYNSTIDEKPNNLSYKINSSGTSTDISTYCIASYIEGTASPANIITIPLWCTSLRVTLIGGGGGGGSKSNTYASTPGAHDNYDVVSLKRSGYMRHGYPVKTHFVDTENKSRHEQQQQWHVQYQDGEGGSDDIDEYRVWHQEVDVVTNTPSGDGGGGGGGGFIYFNTSVTGGSPVNITIGSSGGSNTSGDNSSIVIGSTTYTAGGGIGASATGVGGAENSSSAVTTTVTTKVNGFTGIGSVGGNSGAINYLKTLTYGKGGGGATAVTTGSTNTVAGSSGSSGYYRVYYLTS